MEGGRREGNANGGANKDDGGWEKGVEG